MLNRPLPKRLSAAQKQFFEENGYLVVKQALAPEYVEHFLAVIEALESRARTVLATPATQTVEIRNAIAKEHKFLDLIDWPTTFPLLAEMMGPSIQMNTSHVMVRPPQPEGTAASFKAINWHRDGHSNIPAVHGTCPWLYSKIGYFLTDLSRPGMGNLRVIPGSHKHAEKPDQSESDIDPAGAIEVLIEAGDAIFFQQRLWHAVGPNFSKITRKNVYFGYCYRWLKPLDYLTAPAQLLEKATPIQRQLLGEYCSEMTFWLPKEDEEPLRAWLKNHCEARTESAAIPAIQM